MRSSEHGQRPKPSLPDAFRGAGVEKWAKWVQELLKTAEWKTGSRVVQFLFFRQLLVVGHCWLALATKDHLHYYLVEAKTVVSIGRSTSQTYLLR